MDRVREDWNRDDLELPFDKRRNATGARGPKIDFRLREGWERIIDVLIQRARERGIPWQTRGDLCREAVEWFVVALERQLLYDDGVISGFVAQMEIDDRLAWLRELKSRADTAVTTISELLAELITAGEIARAQDEYQQFLGRVGRIRDKLRRRYYSEAFEHVELWGEVSKALESMRQEAAGGVDDQNEPKERG